MENLKIVLLDGATINPGDLSWSGFDVYGSFTAYDATPADLAPQRLSGADILVTSKVAITEELLEQCPTIKFILETATGYNNIDLEACRKRKIGVANVPAYATDAVAQHVFAFILEYCNNVALHSESVRKGDWCTSPYFTYWKAPLILLAGKSLGIIGYGSIGKQAAKIAAAFGMTINVYSQDPEKTITSDFLSLHCPATPENQEFVNEAFINRMKDGAVLINTARGVLIDEQALASALQSGKLAAAYLDVLTEEPPSPENPLLSAPNCFITPHLAWAPKEMRKLVIDTCLSNLESFLNGGLQNRVDL